MTNQNILPKISDILGDEKHHEEDDKNPLPPIKKSYNIGRTNAYQYINRKVKPELIQNKKIKVYPSLADYKSAGFFVNKKGLVSWYL